MFRSGLLEDTALCLAGEAPAVHDRLQGLGAAVAPLGLSADEAAVLAEVAATPAPLVVVAATERAFVAAGAGEDGLRAAIDAAFVVVRTVATTHFIASEAPHPGGRVVLLAPRPDAGALAVPTAAALENLVRSLSTEWARFGITTVAVLPGDGTPDEAVADLVAFLTSPAGAYVSGTALRLG